MTLYTRNSFVLSIEDIPQAIFYKQNTNYKYNSISKQISKSHFKFHKFSSNNPFKKTHFFQYNFKTQKFTPYT